MKDIKTNKRGWCDNCGAAVMGKMLHHPKMTPSKWWGCQACGAELKPLESLTPDEKGMVDMQDWLREVSRSGKNGPSPQQAAEFLGCHRSMIDRLIGLDVLEKSEFCFKGQKLIIISQRSLDLASENRKRTGNWTGYPVRRGKCA